MSEFTTPQNVPPAGEPLVYRPVSGLAIIGFIVAVLFAGFFVVRFAMAVWSGSPFYFDAWSLIVPACAVALGIMARTQIRQSEGTRAGLKLANWAIGISIVIGLVCGTFSFVTGLALRQQAGAFLMDEGSESGFFPHLLRAGKNPVDLNAAFLLTQPPHKRSGINPENQELILRQFDGIDPNMGAGELTMFRNNPAVLLILLTPPEEVKLEALGVASWKYENKSYQVTRNFRLTVPDGVIEFPVTIASSEGMEGEHRKWYIVGLPDSRTMSIVRNKRGEAVKYLSRPAKTFAQGEFRTKAIDLKAKDGTQWDQLSIGPFAEPVRKAVTAALAKAGTVKVMFPQEDFSVARIEDGRLILSYPTQMEMIPGGGVPPEMGPKKLFLFGDVEVRSTEPIDLEKSTFSPSWEIHRIIFRRAGIVPYMPKGKGK